MRGHVRGGRGVVVLALAVLPWAVASQGGLVGAGASTAVPESSAAIESLTMLLVVTADRPTVGVGLKRTDGARVLWATPAGRSTLHLQIGLVHAAWPAVPIQRAQPLALHLAGRGPPLALGA
ncbi:MAG TPA: hypothetical protein VKC55_03475 [Actinomycetota bacterium]|nr:hypothetical protein [Actinomycetota bacterium]